MRFFAFFFSDCTEREVLKSFGFTGRGSSDLANHVHGFSRVSVAMQELDALGTLRWFGISGYLQGCKRRCLPIVVTVQIG